MKGRFETFTVLIAKINRNIKKIKNKAVAEYGLRGTHASCLYYIYCSDSLTATELCERCEEDKATISRTVDFLEKNGYVVCESEQSKRYKSPLFLTEKGKAVAAEIADKINLVLDEISVGLSEAERVEFYRYLAVISEGLEGISSELF